MDITRLIIKTGKLGKIRFCSKLSAKSEICVSTPARHAVYAWGCSGRLIKAAATREWLPWFISQVIVCSPHHRTSAQFACRREIRVIVNISACYVGNTHVNTTVQVNLSTVVLKCENCAVLLDDMCHYHFFICFCWFIFDFLCYNIILMINDRFAIKRRIEFCCIKIFICFTS